MKKLNLYITEKLKINKDIKISGKIDYELVGNILYMCGWNFKLNEAEEFIKRKEKHPLVDGIIKWVNKYNISNVKPIADYKNLIDWMEEKDIVNMFINDDKLIAEYIDKFVEDRKFIIKVDGTDPSTQYEIYYDKTALLYRESDNGDFWASRLFIKEN